jgi:hypothetical protein
MEEEAVPREVGVAPKAEAARKAKIVRREAQVVPKEAAETIVPREAAETTVPREAEGDLKVEEETVVPLEVEAAPQVEADSAAGSQIVPEPSVLSAEIRLG